MKEFVEARTSCIQTGSGHSDRAEPRVQNSWELSFSFTFFMIFTVVNPL